jgi:hypothetical protein
MSWFTRNTGKEWTTADLRKLKQLAKDDTPTPLIALKLGRTIASVSSKAAKKGISLMQSPHPKKRKRKSSADPEIPT